MDEAIYQCYASNLHGVAVSVKISLVEASLSDFPEVAARTLKHALGDDVVLRCTPPRSVPDAEIFWTRRYRYGLAIPRIEESSRFLVDDSGIVATTDCYGGIHILVVSMLAQLSDAGDQ